MFETITIQGVAFGIDDVVDIDTYNDYVEIETTDIAKAIELIAKCKHLMTIEKFGNTFRVFKAQKGCVCLWQNGDSTVLNFGKRKRLLKEINSGDIL